MTVRLRSYLETQALSRPFSALAEEIGLEEKTVRRVLVDAVKQWDKTRRVLTPTVLGIDEVVFQQPRCVLTNVESRTLLDILPSRTYAVVVEYLRCLPHPERVHWVTMDMWRPYREAAHHALPHAKIVVDKFHVLRMANAALDAVRKQVRTSLSSKERRTLMHDRFLLLRRAHELTPMEHVLVETWTKDLPLLGQAYQAKEVFYEVYETNVRRDAEQRYHQWRENLDHKIHPFFGPLMTAMQNWHDEIFTYFDHPVTNAYTESANNLIRAMQRMGRGYSFAVLRAKMLYTAGVQKLETPRYGSEPFTAVMQDMIAHRLFNGMPTHQVRRDATASRLLGSDFAKLVTVLAREHRIVPHPGKI